MVDWGGKVAAWFGGVAGVSAALAALILAKPATPLHGWPRFWFVALVVLAVACLAMLLLIGLRAVRIVWRDRRDRRARKHVLLVGDRLSPGESLYSPNGTLRLTMQEDGNLVVYYGAHVAIWASDTAMLDSANYLTLREDGNLVLCTPKGAVLRQSHTAGKGGKSLQLQDDTNLVLLSAEGPVWASGGVGRWAPDSPVSM